MKRLMKSMVLMAAAALTLASCAKENISESNNGEQKFAEVSFKAEIPAYQTTKSTIDVDSLTFNTRWAKDDQMGMSYSYGETGSKIEGENVPAKYSKDGSYTVNLPIKYTGRWDYYVYYPYQSTMTSSKYVEIPFGSERTQKGNAINPDYDIMHGLHGTKNAAAGKEDDGTSIRFEMERLTSLLHFHFTSSLNEKVLRATLSVDGDPIAADKYVMHVDMTNATTSYTTGSTSNEITLNITDATADDFSLWFSILPYDETYRDNGIENIRLVVETETKTFSITNPNTDVDIYEAGQIHSITATVPDNAWKDKTTPTPPATKAYYEKVTTAPTDWSGDYLIVYETGSVAFDGSRATLDVANNGKTVTITNNQIEATEETDAISFVINAVDGGYTIQSTSGKYIDGDSDNTKNGLSEDMYSKFVNTITLDQIKGSQGQTIKYNKASGQCRFRYYTSSSKQEVVTLYKRSENIGNRPTLTVTAPESLSLTAQGGTTEIFTVATNQETWKADSDNEEFTVNQTGNGFTVSTSVNPTLSERTATITVSAGLAKSQTFTIKQSAATFKFAQAREEVILNADKGDTKQVTIVSDYDWEAEIPADAKFSVTPLSFIYAEGETAKSGTAKSQTVIFKALENNTSEDGTLTLGTITFSNKQNNSKLAITVKQESSFVEPFITLSPESAEVAADVTTASFNIQSNVAWTVSTDAEWITDWTKSGSNDGTVTIKFGANTTSTARTAIFTVKSVDNTISKTFTLTQKSNSSTPAVKTLLFSEGFGNNTGSARTWQDTYKEQSGISSIYSGASYTITGAKQTKNSVGKTNSGLSQASNGTDATFRVGPLDVKGYENFSVSYYWKAGSIKGTYSTTLYYSIDGTNYTKVANTAKGSTVFVEVNNDLSTINSEKLYLKIIFNTSNTQAVIDDVKLFGYPK